MNTATLNAADIADFLALTPVAQNIADVKQSPGGFYVVVTVDHVDNVRNVGSFLRNAGPWTIIDGGNETELWVTPVGVYNSPWN